MKPILLEYNEMSDSKEVYESKPNPFFAIFIYAILIATIITIVWAALFKIDIVVKGTGIVTAREDSSVVTNTYTGKITQCYVKDGQYVEKGDILYEIEATDMNLQLDEYQNQLSECDDRLSAMNGYLAWLNDRDTELVISKDNPFYDEFMARKQILLLQLQSADNQYDAQKKTINSKISSGENMLVYYNEEMNKMKLLSMAIQTRTNPFDESDAFYYAKVNQYITDYNNLVARYDNAIQTIENEIKIANDEINEANGNIKKAEDAISSANKDIEVSKAKIEDAQRPKQDITIAELNVLVADDELQIDEAQESDEVQENDEVENTDVVKESLTLYAAQNNNIDINAEQTQILKKENEVISAKSNKAQAESVKKTQELQIKAKQESIKAQQLEKRTALSSLETETIASVEASILSHQQSVVSLNGTLEEAKSSQSTSLRQELANSKDGLVQSEIQKISTEISSYKSQNQSIQSKITQVENGKSDSIVKAPSSGIVNLSQNLVEGNYLTGGTTVLTVIPKEENLKIKTYINNKDIAKVMDNMDVKYEMAAYPSRDYGTMNGTIEFVSPDLKANAEDGSAYYLIESSIDSSNLYNKNGEKAELKVGMYCETKVIVEQKSVLKLVLEKINLID